MRIEFRGEPFDAVEVREYAHLGDKNRKEIVRIEIPGVKVFLEEKDIREFKSLLWTKLLQMGRSVQKIKFSCQVPMLTFEVMMWKDKAKIDKGPVYRAVKQYFETHYRGFWR